MPKRKTTTRGDRRQDAKNRRTADNHRVLAADNSLKGLRRQARVAAGRKPNLPNRAAPGSACRKAGQKTGSS